MNMSTLGERLKMACAISGLSLSQVVEWAGISHMTVSSMSVG